MNHTTLPSHTPLEFHCYTAVYFVRFAQILFLLPLGDCCMFDISLSCLCLRHPLLFLLKRQMQIPLCYVHQMLNPNFLKISIKRRRNNVDHRVW